jgi:hypothetical protein
MLIESAFVKPVVDAIVAVFRGAKNHRLKQNAEQEITHAIRELLLANPNENKVKAKLAVARAAGHISPDALLAEEMLRKVQGSRKKRVTGRKKKVGGRKKRVSKKRMKKRARKK